MVIASSNNFEILALHEASHECIWLRSIMIQYIQDTCKLPLIKRKAKILYEDNIACISQVK